MRYIILEFHQRQSGRASGAQPPGQGIRGVLGVSSARTGTFGSSPQAVWGRRSKWMCASGSVLLGSLKTVLAGQGRGVQFPPGLRWFQWGRSFQSSEPWLESGKATFQPRPGVPTRKRPAERARPHGNTTRGLAWPTLGAEEGVKKESGQPGHCENAPSWSVPPARQQPWCNPRRKRLPDGSGLRAQLWLRVYLVLLSPAVPPPSLETDWSNVSSEHPVPTSKLPEPRQATASAPRLPSGPLSPPRASSSTATALWPEDPPGSPLIFGGGAQSPKTFVPRFYTLCSSAFPGHLRFFQLFR